MRSTTFHVRAPARLTKSARKIVERNGLDLPTAVRLFFTHIVANGTMPLPWLTVNGYAVEAEKKLLEQIRKPDIVGKPLRTRKDIDAFLDAL